MDFTEPPYCIETLSSAVMGVPFSVVAPKLKNILEIKNFGLNRAVSCCLVENGLQPTSVGCIRRSVLCPIDPALKGRGGGEGPRTTRESAVEEFIIREQLSSVRHDSYRVEVGLEYVPCAPAEANRSPFGLLGAQYLESSRTVYSAVMSTQNPNQCFVSIHNTTYLRETKATSIVDHWRAFSTRRGDGAGMEPHDPVNLSEDEERGIAAKHIQFIWRTFLDRILASLDQSVMDEAFAVLDAGSSQQLQKDYNTFESSYCKWAATSSATLCRDTVVETVEPALDSWAQALRELKQQRMMVEGIKKDAEGSQQISAEIAKQMVEQQDALRDMLSQQREDSPLAPKEGKTLPSEEGLDALKAAALDNKKSHFPNSHYIYSSDVILSDNITDSIDKEKHAKGNDPSWATGSTPDMITKLFDSNGALVEQVAMEIFSSLLYVAPRSRGQKFLKEEDAYLTSTELTALLLSVETFANKSPVAHSNGVSEQAAGNGKERSAAGGGAAAAAAKSLPAYSTLRKVNNRSDGLQQEAREEAMRSRAVDVISRYDFREKGHLYFDEFCLALMNLFKTQTCV